eukprot:scaffold42526_cov80-Phaeocystis_antarctica.AAC.2
MAIACSAEALAAVFVTNGNQSTRTRFFSIGYNGLPTAIHPLAESCEKFGDAALGRSALAMRPSGVRREILSIRTVGGETFYGLLDSENRSEQLRASVSPTPCARFSQSLL